MKYLAVLGISTLLISPHLTVQAEPITANNWQKHPDIIAIRDIFNAVQSDKASDQLIKKSRIFEYCKPYVDMERHLYTNQQGSPRLYIFSGGSEDSSVTTETYYDTQGRLRFAFIRAGAVNNTTIEHRIYFSIKGKKLWENRKQLTGEGYTFPELWPINTLPKKPLKAFSAAHPCLEES